MDTTNIINIVIVGDFLIFRNGLKLLLETEKCFRVVGEASDLLEASRITAKIVPDVFLIESTEIDDGDLDSFTSALSNTVPILVLTNSKHEEKNQKYLELGLSGVLSKDNDAEALFKAIKRVSVGELWFQRKLIMDTVQQLVKEKKAHPELPYSYYGSVLTTRERELLTLICQGMKNKEIADCLFITETTVRHHLTSIFGKLKVNSRLELVVHAFNEKLVEIPGDNRGSLNKMVKVNSVAS
jgi:DNA-binding NarL/FixJ family response regulator